MEPENKYVLTLECEMRGLIKKESLNLIIYIKLKKKIVVNGNGRNHFIKNIIPTATD